MRQSDRRSLLKLCSYDALATCHDTMAAYLSLPLLFLKFWYIDAVVEIGEWFGSLNNAFLSLFSLPLLIRTYFKPLKNEYRKGLVGFSLGMGIVVKSVLIFVSILLFMPLLMLEAVVIITFILIPVMTMYLIFL